MGQGPPNIYSCAVAGACRACFSQLANAGRMEGGYAGGFSTREPQGRMGKQGRGGREAIEKALPKAG